MRGSRYLGWNLLDYMLVHATGRKVYTLQKRRLYSDEFLRRFDMVVLNISASWLMSLMVVVFMCDMKSLI